MIICVSHGIGNERNEKANDDDRRRTAEMEMPQGDEQLRIRLHMERQAEVD